MAIPPNDVQATLVKGTPARFTKLSSAPNVPSLSEPRNSLWEWCVGMGHLSSRTNTMAKEAATNIINLPEDDPTIIKLLLQYLYTTEYDPNIPESDINTPAQLQPWFPHTCGQSRPCQMELCAHHTCEVNCANCCLRFTCQICSETPTYRPAAVPEGGPAQLLLHAKVYKVADKYDISSLKELAKDKFSRACYVYWMKEQDFADAAEHVFTSTPESDQGLRAFVMKTLIAHRVLVAAPVMKPFLQKRPELTYELLTHGVLRRR
ncbi:hypothetical protein FB567DRAFT_546290 [Paraphoma chrysanthemicola]|uniref:BTB domain-containing protein n=1 Tax=Paraphoma chrysanthemicola TaxID=798071 RepID=A0A8K0W1T4_9PLEO|nr:hypothetical protein FB567DRAFT_546290 [Paraphoma chrysanthemicola]